MTTFPEGSVEVDDDRDQPRRYRRRHPQPGHRDDDAVGPAVAQHLRARLALIEDRVRRAVALRRENDPLPDDPWRGLQLSDAAAWQLLDDAGLDRLVELLDPAGLAAVERAADRAEADGVALPLRRLAHTFGLTGFDID